MTQSIAPWGVRFVHQYYPGFIDLPTNSIFFINTNGIRGAVHLVEHTRPLVITDFNNGIDVIQDGVKSITRLRHSITEINENNLCLSAKGFEGRSGHILAIEHDINGKVLRPDMFTSMQTLFEIDKNEDVDDSNAMRFHRKFLEMFVSTYRYMNPDMRLSTAFIAPTINTPTRLSFHQYTLADLKLSWEERLRSANPGKWRISIGSYSDGARSLQDHSQSEMDRHNLGENVGALLRAGFELPQSLIEIERLADLAFVDGKLRVALAEAMSILEIAIIEAEQKLMNEKVTKKFASKKNQIPWNRLINTILPKILELFEGDRKGLMSSAREALELRHKVVHRQYTPSKKEVNLVLSFVRTFLQIVEIDDQFKPSWRSKNTNNDPMMN